MIEVVSINEYGTGRYILDYNVYSPCMCSHVRETKIIKADKKPTKEEALKIYYGTND